MKLNVLLARAEHSGAQFRELIKNYLHAFKNNQKLFKGVRQTYMPEEGCPDEPSKRGNIVVQNTVTEYLAYFVKTSSDHVTHLFDIEATNAHGNAKAELLVEGINFGVLSSLELLRLKSFLDAKDLTDMYTTLPVRPDDQNWTKTDDEEYRDKDIYETARFDSLNRTTLKEQYILSDPNIGHFKDASKYVPQVASKDTHIILGRQTGQFFSGETSHRYRAAVLGRLTLLKGAVKEALVKANEAEAVKSEITANKIFNYLHTGGDISSLTKL
jgi:hypothetical protein